MNGKAFTILNPRSPVRCFRIMAAKNTEKSVSLADSDVQTFVKGKENQNTKRKTESYVINGFGNGISRGWQRKSTTKRFATGRFLPCTNSITENFVYWKVDPLFVFVVIQHMFSSWVRQRTNTIFIWGLSFKWLNCVYISSLVSSRGEPAFEEKYHIYARPCINLSI